MEDSIMSKQNFKFGTVKGDVIGAGASGIIAKNITGNITLGTSQLEQMPDEYARGLQDFTDKINQLLQAHQVNQKQVAPVQQTLREFSEEVAELEPDQEPDFVKKVSLKSKLVSAAAGLSKLLPRGVEVVAAFTPLAPFGKLIGEAVDTIVKNVVKE